MIISNWKGNFKMLTNSFFTFFNPLSPWSYLLVINFLAFIIYAFDKYKAVAGGYRIPERLLLFIALIGGSYGAWLSMKIVHHKTRKTIFVKGIPLIMLCETMALAFIFGCAVSSACT